MVLKPSEQASCSILELMDILLDADIPPGVLNVVTGYGHTTGEPLIDHPDVRMVSFTGGTNGGKAAAKIASQQVKPIVMELGGKSPQIVLPDADIDLAVNGVASGIFPAGGQSCISGSRLLIHSSIIDKFTEQLVKVCKRANVGDPLQESTTIGPIANRVHYERILDNIDKAQKEGHNLVLDGRNECRDNGFYIGPTIFKDVPNTTYLAQNEIFGPVVSVIKFKDEAEALEIANDTLYGLGAGVWTRNGNIAYRMGRAIQAGIVWTNCYHAYPAHSPFGGYKQSGVGRETHKMMLDHYRQNKNLHVSYAEKKLGFF